MEADMPMHQVEDGDGKDASADTVNDVEMSGFVPDYFEVRASLLR